MINQIDELLITKLPHLQSHHCYLPHIGVRYNDSSSKLLIIAKSHYLNKKFNNRFSAEDWYNYPKNIYPLIDKFKTGINTRLVIQDYMTSKKLCKAYTIFRNLENTYSRLFKDFRMFEECVFINYFQRPSQINGDSIAVHRLDKEVALQNLITINEILKPEKIIFVSKLAYDNFKKSITPSQLENFQYINFVPHPASAWWNRTAPKYGINKDGNIANGREKFERIITPKK